jgi:hypothetical protein
LLYQRIAENLVHNACYSDAAPDQATCTPVWGNQPPGYPFFIALLKLVGAGAPQGLVAIQSLVFCGAVAYLLLSLRSAHPNHRWLLPGVALVIGLSALTAGWSHWIRTETLAASATIWVMAECVRSLSARVFRTIPISLAVAGGAMMRWDLVWLLLPVLVVAWQLRSMPGFWVRATMPIGAVGLPILLLLARAAVVGLPIVPAALNAGPDEIPPGIRRFWEVASTSQAATSELLWPVWNREYGDIASRFDYDAVTRRIDRSHLRSALERLSAVPHRQPVPTGVDDSFAVMAQALISESGVRYWPEIWLERSMAIWMKKDVVTHSGWPSNIERYLQPARLIFLALTLLSPLLLGRGTWERALGVGVLLLVVTRTLFLVVLNGLETRYLAPMVPAMELMAVLTAAQLAGRSALKRK